MKNLRKYVVKDMKGTQKIQRGPVVVAFEDGVTYIDPDNPVQIEIVTELGGKEETEKKKPPKKESDK